MKPEKVQSTSSSSDASSNFKCQDPQENSSLFPCSKSNSDALKDKLRNVNKEATVCEEQVISRYSSEKSNNDREVSVFDDGVSRADEEQSTLQSKLCLIKCKNIENELNVDSSTEDRPLIKKDEVIVQSINKSAKLISLKKNGSTLVFQKKLNSQQTTNNNNVTARKNSLKYWQSSSTNSNNSKSQNQPWTVPSFFSSNSQNFNENAVSIIICVLNFIRRIVVNLTEMIAMIEVK
jgi:hypothetical protein